MLQQRKGRWYFLKFYLLAIIAGGLIGAITDWITLASGGGPSLLLGASGGCIAATVLFALFYPNEELLLFAVYPVKAWIIAAFYVGMDLFGVINQSIGGMVFINGVHGSLSWCRVRLFDLCQPLEVRFT